MYEDKGRGNGQRLYLSYQLYTVPTVCDQNLFYLFK